jgi:signal transduction histidine kinase
VEFVVSDTGIGIRAEDQESVFASFSQVDGSTTRRYGGSGLGLAICRELTQLMGGTIAMQSSFGTGSTFVLRVPLVDVALDPLEPGQTPILRHVS